MTFLSIASDTLPAALSALVWLSLAAPVLAHCDGMDGPVVKAAQQALEKGDVNLVLVWVQKGDEASLRKAFGDTLAVRKLGPEAKGLADTYFFETLVRLHRAGEGAPYTGLKPAGRDLGPAIPAADKALETGNPKPLLKLLGDSVQEGVEESFHRAADLKKHAKDDVEAGRKYVEAYVVFLHKVEALHKIAVRPAEGHFSEGAPPAPHHED